MSMKVKSSLVRKYRTKLMWSQEQLAAACGLGLRTIQRIEARGTASTETIKALASVFEVTADTLVWKDGYYQVYKHKQWSVLILTVMPSICVVILLVDNIYNQLPSSVIGVLFGLLTILTVAFSSITIEVNESEIKWFFGPGVLSKTLPLENVSKFISVKNPIWMGFGIHPFGTGYIYNVSGLLGVEIELKSGSFIRLGTDEPNYLVAAIEDAQANTEF